MNDELKQTSIEGAPPRVIPETPIRPRKAQTTKPLPLELPEIEAREPKLF